MRKKVEKKKELWKMSKIKCLLFNESTINKSKHAKENAFYLLNFPTLAREERGFMMRMRERG